MTWRQYLRSGRGLTYSLGAILFATLGFSSMCAAQNQERSAMTEGYSQRALSVLFIARVKAGERGAPAIDVEHLLTAIITEDQSDGRLPGTLTKRHSIVSAPPHQKFFPTDVAAKLLDTINGPPAQSAKIPAHQDMGMSPEAAQGWKGAREIQKQFKAEEVEPLHILAALLEDQSNSAVQSVLQAGITRERVLQAIGNNP